MKKSILLLIISCCVVFCLSAQENSHKPMLEKGKAWVFEKEIRYLFDNIEDQEYYGDCKMTHQYTVEPIIFNARNGKVTLRVSYNNEVEDENLAIPEFYYILKEEDNVLYGIHGYGFDNNVNQLIDFNLKKGDSFDLNYGEE